MKKSVRFSFLTALLGVMVHSAAQADFVFAINEGITYRVNPLATVERMRDVASDLEKILKQPVSIRAVPVYVDLTDGLKKQSYDLAYVHPAHISIRALRDSGYRLVAVTKGWTDYSANFMVKANSELKTLTDLKGKKVGAPDADSITSTLMRASLRDAVGADQTTFQYVREQDAVPFMVENGFTAVGVSASRSVIKNWEGKGGRVIGKSKSVPIKHLIAGPKITEEQRKLVAQYFTSMEDAKDGKQRLEAMNVQGFTSYDEKALLEFGRWMGI